MVLKTILIVGSDYRVLTPDDVEPIIENVTSTINCVLPIALFLFVILLIIDILPAVIDKLMDKEFRSILKYILTNGYHALRARLNKNKNQKEGKQNESANSRESPDEIH